MTDDLAAGAAPGRRSWLSGRALGIDIFAVMTSGAATGLLGFAFWTLAARGYSTAEVGRASAMISSATLISILATLSLGSLYERFLPVAGVDARRYVRSGLSVVVVSALLFGTTFLFVGPREKLFPNLAEMLVFPFFVVFLAIFAVQDQVLVGLGRTRTILTKNVGQSTAKLIAVGTFIPLATGSAIVWAWVLPAAVIAILIGLRVIWPVSRRREGRPDLPPRRDLVHFFVSSYAINGIAVLVPLLVPLIIVSRLGTQMNAYFSMCWLVCNTLGVLLMATAAPFVATASSPGTDLRACTLRFTVMCGGAALAGCIGLLICAPLVLGIMGRDYAIQGTELIRLMALTLPAVAVMVIYTAMARLRRKLKLAVSIQILAGVMIVGGVALTTPIWGINAVGYTYLATEAVCTLIIIVPTVRLVRSALRAAPAPAAPPDHDGVTAGGAHPVDRPFEFSSVTAQFAVVAAAQPESTAVRTATGAVSYGELHSAAARWAEDLGARPGAAPQQVTLLSAAVSPATVAAVLGVFSSDTVLAAVDPGLPPSRVRTIVDILDTQGWQAATLLTDHTGGPLTAEVGAGRRILDIASGPSISEHEVAQPLPEGKPGLDDLTSIQFTSGSSGTPKAVRHGNGMWLCDAQLMADRFGIGPGRRVALCMPISFGAGLNVLIGSLLGGAEVIAVDPRTETPRGAFERIGDTGAQVIVATPAFLDAMCTAAHRDQLPGLERIVTTGEAANPRHVHRARILAPNAVFTNWVGSSEASAIATYDIAPGATIPDGAIPAGIPAPHKHIELDADGALSITSRYLALGYLDPAMADSRFTENADGTRTFSGGDIGRWDDAGNLMLLGRADAAVKINGYLVEPAEVEAALLRYPEIREAVVVACPELTAYLAPEHDVRAPAVADLRARLHRDLPNWMVPRNLVVLSALPRTERGKVDRRALPVPTRAAGAPPRGKLETAVAQIWTEVLQLAEIGRTEGFYALGGDSLTGTQMLARISDQHGVHLSHADLASAPTVAQFAETIAARTSPRAQRIPSHRDHLAATTVPIRPFPADPADAGPALFCFTGAGASALTFVPLADRVDPEMPVYAFIPNGLENRGLPDWTVARAATRYLRDLRRLQSHGPYVLVGHSLGCYIGLEVARRLENAGETVELVALLDPFLSPRAVREARREVPDATVTLDGARLPRAELWRRRMLIPLAGIVQRRGQRQAQALEEVGVRVGLMHRPQPWPGRALLVLSSLNHDDRRLWPYLLPGDLTVETVDCDHHSIVREPHVSAVADLIAAHRAAVHAGAANRMSPTTP